jgi:hypothetical protein
MGSDGRGTYTSLSPFPGLTITAPCDWRREKDAVPQRAAPISLLPLRGGGVVQLSWLPAPVGGTDIPGLRSKAVGAATRWHDAEFPDHPSDEVLTIEAQDFDFGDSAGVWLEAPHATERLRLRKAFGVGLRAWEAGVLVVTWIGPASEPLSLTEARRIFETAQLGDASLASR